MKNQVKTILLLGVLSAILIALGGMLGHGYLYLFLAMSVVMNLVAYFFSDKIVLKMSRARPVSEAEAPELHNMVAELAYNANIPKPRVYLIPDPQPNAFATGRNPKNGVVAVTEGILRRLNARELRGVIAHELAHIRNRDILVASVAAMVASAIAYIANAVQWAAIFGGASRDSDDNGSAIGALAMAFIAPIAAMLVQMGISRSREYLADETGARISRDPEALASALEKLHASAAVVPSLAAEHPATASMYIVNPFSGGGGMLSWFSTHPPMAERVRRLREMAMTISY